MASTRAKARVLRDMTNVGMTCLEEPGDLNEVIGDDISKRLLPKGTPVDVTPLLNGSEVSKGKSPETAILSDMIPKGHGKIGHIVRLMTSQA